MSARNHDALCSFCANALAPDDRVASIKLLSHAHGFLYFGAHVQCLQQAVQSQFAQQIDLADVPAGIDHFLTLKVPIQTSTS